MRLYTSPDLYNWADKGLIIPPQPGVGQRHKENTSISRYVWLPIEWQGDKPVIRWKDKWKV